MNGKGHAVQIGQNAAVGLEIEGQLVGVEQLAALSIGLVFGIGTVFSVTQQRMTDCRHLRTNLMGAAGQQSALDQR